MMRDKRLSDMGVEELREYKFEVIGEIKKLQKLTRQIDKNIKELLWQK